MLTPETRNFHSYNLLIDTYAKLQTFFDEQDVINYFEGYDYDDSFQEEFGISSSEAYDLVSSIAYRFRKYLDNDDTWERILRCAIADEINEYEKERKE